MNERIITTHHIMDIQHIMDILEENLQGRIQGGAVRDAPPPERFWGGGASPPLDFQNLEKEHCRSP